MITLEPTSSEQRRAAVLTVCYAARERDVDEIRDLLAMIGLDPWEARRGDVRPVE